MNRKLAEEIVNRSINLMRLKSGYIQPTPEERENMIKKWMEKKN